MAIKGRVKYTCPFVGCKSFHPARSSNLTTRPLPERMVAYPAAVTAANVRESGLIHIKGPRMRSQLALRTSAQQ